MTSKFPFIFNHTLMFLWPYRWRPSWWTSSGALWTAPSSLTASPRLAANWNSRCRWWFGSKVGQSARHTHGTLTRTHQTSLSPQSSDLSYLSSRSHFLRWVSAVTNTEPLMGAIIDESSSPRKPALRNMQTFIDFSSQGQAGGRAGFICFVLNFSGRTWIIALSPIGPSILIEGLGRLLQ